MHIEQDSRAFSNALSNLIRKKIEAERRAQDLIDDGAARSEEMQRSLEEAIGEGCCADSDEVADSAVALAGIAEDLPATVRLLAQCRLLAAKAETVEGGIAANDSGRLPAGT